jgi:tetratricopeptide (TPR) repeat protein
LQGLLAIDVAQKQPAKALARVNAQIARVPTNAAYYVLQANLLVHANDLQAAESALTKAVELNKNNTDALLMLARLQESRGSIDRASASYEQLLQRNPRDVRSYVLFGALEETRGDWQKAEKLYQKALEIDADYALANNNLAYLMLQHGGNIDVALSHAQAARLRMPEDSHIADTLACAYLQKGAYETAIELLKQALQKSPDDATYHYHIALAYEKGDHKAEAKEHFKRAVALNPRYAQPEEMRKTGS